MPARLNPAQARSLPEKGPLQIGNLVVLETYQPNEEGLPQVAFTASL
jgi:hypothetical protein